MLQKTTITISLGLGVNTKTDEKLVEHGQFNLVAENATFAKVGAVQKRQAFASISDNYYNPDSSSGTTGTISSLTYKPTNVAALDDCVFLRNQVGEYLYSHNDSFLYKPSNPIPEVKVTSKLVYSTTASVDHTDCVYDSAEDIILAIARDGNKTSDLSGTSVQKATLVIHDRATGSSIVTRALPNGSSSSPYGYARCGVSRVAGVSYYYAAATDTGLNLNIYIFNKYGQKNATEFSIANMQSAGTTNYGPLASCHSDDGETVFFIATTTTANTGRFIAIRGTVKTYDVTFTFTGGGVASMTGATAKYSGGYVYFAYNGARQIVFNPDGTIHTADAALSSLSVAYGISYDQDNVTRILGNNNANAVLWNNGTQSTENESSYLITDKVTIGGVEVYCLQANDTYYLVGLANGSGKSGQKACAMVAKGISIPSYKLDYFKYAPARIAKIDANTCAIAIPVVTDIDGPSSSSCGMQITTFEINQNYKSNSRAIIGKSVYLQGGFLAEFDGQSLTENGFLFTPTTPTVDTATAGSLTGTYNYKILLKYTDADGQVTKSAPSLAVSTGSITSKAPKLSVAISPFGIKPGKCSIETYRTTNGGSTFYFHSSYPVNLYSSATLTAYITDATADANITSNEILYTTGDVLQNDPGPSCDAVVQGGNRLFLVGLEDKNEIAYSKQKLFGESVNFSDFFRIRIDTAQFSTSGGLVSGGYMDDKLILFKRNSIFYVTGSGPSETGAGGFTGPEMISAETGCTDPRSVVLTPKGLMFKGDKGIYLLSRGMETQYIGAPVEEYNSYQVTAAVHVDKKNLVVFSMKKTDVDEGVLVSYDYYTEQWSVIPDKFVLDADLVDGDLVAVDGLTNRPQTQTGTDFLDAGSAYATKVKTPWIKVSGIQDFARIWSCTILGKYKAAHNLIVKVRYDYDNSYVETYTITPQNTDSQYQYRCHLQKQKCEAVQFEIYDSNQTGESMELTALTLEVGLRKGSMKLPAARKY